MIDVKLQAELRAKFNPDGSELRELQLRMLDILKYIDGVCKEHNITYWLSSGTCLGAVRHGGFIPWDDDVDIEMLEEDYVKFVAIMGLEPSNGYVLQTHLNEPTYIYTFGKVRDFRTIMKEGGDYDNNFKYKGAFVDVFHLEPSRSLLAHKIMAPLHWRAINYKQDKRFNIRIKCGILRCIERIVGPLLHKVDASFPGNQLRQSLGSHFKIPRYRNELFPVTCMPFEDTVLPVPGNYDKYLTRLYGDYMRMPNLQNHIPHTSAVQFLE